MPSFLQGDELARVTDLNQRNATKQKLHTRAYEIDAYLEDDDHIRIVGHLRDVKPDGLWGIEDSEPMTIHHMQLELVIDGATLVITHVDVFMHVHPQTYCTEAVPKYEQLVGLSIARGFTNKVKELFGGPRACTHIGALINAMAPVAIQTLWAFAAIQREKAGRGSEPYTDAEKVAGQQRNLNTCHVWATDGPVMELFANAEPVPVALWAKRRLKERDIDIATWTGTRD
jgi:Protein of unknown function (DUF2889)